MTLSIRLLATLLMLLGASVACQAQNTPEAGTQETNERLVGIRQLFDELTEFASSAEEPSADANPVIDRFAIDPFIDLVKGRIQSADDEQKDRLVSDLKGRRELIASNWRAFMGWDDYRIHSAVFHSDGTAEVDVKHWNDELETYSKYRWWLVQRDGRWMFYDYEDLDQKMRISSFLAYMIDATISRQPWLTDFAALLAAMQQAGSIEELVFGLDEYQDRIDNLLEHDLPIDIRGFVLLLKTAWLLQAEGDIEDHALEALDLLDEIESLDSQCMSVHQLRGDALAATESYDLALKSYQIYAEHFGWDASICESVSDAWYWNDNSQKAIEFAEMGLKDNHRSWGCLASLAVALPAEQKSGLDPHLARLNFDEAAISYVADWALALNDMDAARHVYHLLVQHHPESALIAEYQEILDQ